MIGKTQTDKNVLERLRDRGFTNRALAERLNVHVNNFSRMTLEDGSLMKHWECALLWVEHLLDEEFRVVRSGSVCSGHDDLSPIIEASVAYISARTGIDYVVFLKQDGFDTIEPTSRVRFEHADSDAARRAELARDPVAGSRTWKMLVEVDGRWHETSFNKYLDKEMIELGATRADVSKYLGMWTVEANTRYGWTIIGTFQADDIAGAFEQARERMRGRTDPVIQWRASRAG